MSGVDADATLLVLPGLQAGLFPMICHSPHVRSYGFWLFHYLKKEDATRGSDGRNLLLHKLAQKRCIPSWGTTRV